MVKNTTGFQFSNEPSSPNSDVNAENLNGAVEKAVIRNIAEGAILPGHLHGNVAGAGIGGGNGSALYVKTDSNSIEIENDSIQVKKSGITTEHILDGSITLEKLSQAVQDKINTVLRGMYSVGDFFITRNATFNPASRFGGQWELLKDKFLIGAGGDFTLASTGGERVHKLTLAEMPSHSHGANYSDGGGKYCNTWHREFGANSGDARGGHVNDFVEYTGGSQPHNNMPPYVAVNIWVKISDEDAQ